MTAGVLEPDQQANRYRADIDGLRALAILLVVAYHAGSTTLTGGYVGVDVFFVLSGYLITGLLVREIELHGRISLREFYARRARRLLPLSSLVLLSTAAAGAWLLPPLARADLLADVRASALYVANWRFSRLSTTYSDVDVAETPLVHFWSLAIEEQFYVLWPLLIVAAVRYSQRRGHKVDLRRVLAALLATVVVASLAASIVLTPRSGGAAYYFTHTRLWELGMGGGLALMLPRLPTIPRRTAELTAALGLAAVLGASMIYDAATPFPGTAALLPVVGTILLIAAGTNPQTRISRLLALRPLPNLGRWSYAWYLWHWPVLGFLTLANQRSDAPMGTTGVVAWAVLGSLALAGVSHHFVENPVRHARMLKAPARSLGLAGALTLLPLIAVTSYLAFGDVGSGVTRPVSQAMADEGSAIDPGTDGIWADFRPPQSPVSPAAAADDVPTSALGCPVGTDVPAPIRPCAFGDPEGQRTVLLIGDSHAAHWLPAVHEIGARRGWQVRLATMGSCAVTDTRISDDGDTRPFSECHRFREELFDAIDTLAPVHAVILGRASHVADRVLEDERLVDDPVELFDLWRAGADRTYTRLLASSEHVIELRDTPGALGDVPGCVSGSPRNQSACDFAAGPSARSDAILYAAEVSVARDGVHHLDPTALVCSSDPCQVVTEQGTIKFRDRAHLTSRFARQLAPAFDTLLPAGVREP